MKELLKKILKAVKLYHPLQLLYRQWLFDIKRQYLRFRYRKFKGDLFTCNVCGKSYLKFAPDYPSPENRIVIHQHAVVAGYGDNIICPNCLSVARDRLVLAMLEKIDLHSKKVLHISPEKNIYTFLCSKATVQTADLIPQFYRNVDKHISKADLTDLPYPDHSFDIVIANHVLEHIPDDRFAMKEIFRVLKSTGVAILQVPFSAILTATLEEPDILDPRKQSLRFGQKDHVRIYSLTDYIKRLQETGFVVNYLDYESLHPLHKFAIQPGEGFFEITK